MHSSTTLAAAVAILPLLTNSAAIEVRGTNEVVYLCNCQDGQGGSSSEMGYYSDDASSRSRQQPDAIARTSSGQTTVWEGQSTIGTFPDGNTFASSGFDHSVAVGAQTGPRPKQSRPFYLLPRRLWGNPCLQWKHL